jgi:uracil-DNA glycosylase
MQGFFDDSELPTVSKRKSKKLSCLQCKLYSDCISPRMLPSGDGKKGIYVLAEAPGRTEDEEGVQLVGKAGTFLKDMLAPMGVVLDRDCIKDNAVRCRPPKNRTPSDIEIESCRLNILESVEKYAPKLILLFGAPALESFVGARFKKALGGISKWRGIVFPDRTYNAWVAPLFHPSFVMRSEKKPVIKKIFGDDVQAALEYLSVPLPQIQDEADCVRIVEGFALETLLSGLLERSKNEKIKLAFDYETTGKKPHAPGHEIVAASLCWDGETSYAFKFPLREDELTLFKRVLRSPRIAKTAHNIKFEDTWSSVILGVKVAGWEWCSMQGSHIINNKPGITGLKFQAIINFGLFGYAEEIEPFLESIDPKNANSFNRVKEIPEKKLLTYCGIDSLVQYRLALKQGPKIADIARSQRM